MFSETIFLSLCTMLPSLYILSDCYYLLVVFLVVLSVILGILVSKIKIEIKLILLIIILSIYQKNLTIFGTLFVKIYNIIYINTIEKRKDNTELVEIVKQIYIPNFNLITDFSKLPDTPSIIVCNYCHDRIENLACILIPRHIVIMMRDQVRNTTKLDKIVKWRIETKDKDSYEDTKKQILEHTRQGRSIFTYITKHPKHKINYISKIRTGVFHIAKELDIPITPIVIDFIDTKFGSIPYQNFRIITGETFKVTNVKKQVYVTKVFFRNTLSFCIKNKKNYNING